MKQIRLILAIAIGALLAQNAHAVVFRISQMVNYSTGNLGTDATTGTLDGWQFPQNEVTITNGSGSLEGTLLGLVASAGDKAEASATANTNQFGCRNQFVPNSTFPQTTETNIYYSWLCRFNDASDVSVDGEKIHVVNRANSGINAGVITGVHWEMYAKNVAGQIQLGIFKAGGTEVTYATTNINAGETVFIVLRQHILPGAANDVYDLWINPPTNTFGLDENSLPPSSVMTTNGVEDASATGPGRFWIGAGANNSFDEFRVASLWAEVTPPFGQCLSAGFDVSPTNRTVIAGLSTILRATASGTSPSLQWQVSTNSGTTWTFIPGAFSSIYTTPNLKLSENGIRYRAIATIPCNGSSATSAVAIASVVASTTTANGVIMDDTFLDPDLGFDDRSNLPLTSSNSVWYTAVTDNLTAFQMGGNMVGTPLAGSSSLWLGYFVETNEVVSLGVWSTIKVTVPFTPNGTVVSGNTGSPLRFGLFDYFDGGNRLIADSAAAGGSQGNGVGVRGYMSTIHFNSTLLDATPIELFARNFLDDNNLMGTTADYASLGSGPPGLVTNATTFVSGSPYTLTFTVTRTAFNTVVVSNIFTGLITPWAFGVIDTNFSYHRFDSFGIRPNSLETTASSFTIPDFKVEVEPFTVPPFNITEVQKPSGNSVRLTWDSSFGVWYQVQSRDSLTTGNWITNATLLSTGTSLSYTNTGIPGTVAQRYYRVVATP